MSRVLAIDAGRTTCRVAVVTDGRAEASTEVAAGGTLADPVGAEQVRAAISAGAERLGEVVRDCTHVAGGFAGAWDDWPGIEGFAEALGEDFPATEVLVTSDVAIAYAGALGLVPGVLLVAGTGAVALGVGEDGGIARVDGWGFVLGDAGSGYWIGRAGLDAVLRARDGRGRPTALVERARERLGAVDRLHATIAADGNPARTVAGFATDVIASARDGDAVAGAILDDAVAELAVTVRAAADRTQGRGATYDVCLAGGLVERDGPVGRRLADALEREVPGASLRPPESSALVGAATIAEDAGPFEAVVRRSGARRAPPASRERPRS